MPSPRYSWSRPALLGQAIDLIDEAGSRIRVRRTTAPPDLREYDESGCRLH